MHIVNKPKPLLLLFIGCFCLNTYCSGQQNFSGKVLDEDYQPLIGASIMLKGTRGAAATHADGTFSMTLPPISGAVTFVITLEGYTTIEKQIEDFDSVYTFRLLKIESGPPADSATMISFPWPPPAFSCQSVLDPKLLKGAKKLKDVDQLLSTALESLHYDDKTYYFIPGGFALVSRIEQINEQGESLPPPARWSVETASQKELSWKEYIRRLFFTTQGYFRIIVFVVTDRPFAASDDKVSREVAMDWVLHGMNVLPAKIGGMSLSASSNCTALIYEYQKPESGKPILHIPGRLTGFDHIKHSKILDVLQGK